MLEFANPLGLSLLVIAPALIYAYRRRRSEKSQTVSSLIILKTLSKKIVQRKKIKLPFRFYIELLALLALACAATLPSSQAKKIAVIFDNSLSMSALEANKKSRLDLAVEKFKSEQSTKDSYSFFTTSPELKNTTLNLKSALSSDQLNPAITHLAAEFEKIWIFSDKKSTDTDPRFKIFDLGTTLNNIYIEAASLNKNHEIKVKLSSASEKKTNLNLIVTGLDFSGNRTKIVAEETLTLNPNSSRELEITSPESELAYKIEVKTNQPDAIEADNTAWLVASDDVSSKILLVSQSNEDSGLENIPGFSVKKINLTEYAALQDFKKYSLVIFHRSAPVSFPPLASLLILPPDGNDLFPVINDKNVKISTWNENHPISSYLRANLISPSRAVEFKTPAWAEAIISGESGSIITAGQHNGNLLAATGIELLPYEGRKTPALSILTVNLIKWLSSKSKIGSENLTGEKFILEQESVVINPNQEVIKIDKNAENKSFDLNLAGIYLLSKQGALAVNTFYPKESNTLIKEELVLPKLELQTKKQVSDWWKYLTIAAITFLTLEMFLKRER